MEPLPILLLQQQHSLLSQVSWGRLEIKPKRDEKQKDMKGIRQKKKKITVKHVDCQPLPMILTNTE
jgi:hypothetical protein